MKLVEKSSLEFVEDQSLLNDNSRGYRLFEFNPVGTLILKGIKNKKKIDQIVKDICLKFSVNESIVKKDVQKFILELKKEKLVKD